MNCQNCGTFNNQGTSFCSNCGVQLVNQTNSVNQINNQVNQSNNQVNQNNKVGQLTIIRRESFIGMALAFSLYVDGYFVAKIKNGETKTFPIYYGAHRIELKQHMNYGYKDIIINDFKPNAVLTANIKMGFFSNKIEITE